MKKPIAWMVLGWVLGVVASADVVRERWGPRTIPCTYANTVQVLGNAKVPRLVFDLSALRKDTRVYSASLHSTSVRQPHDPIEIYPVGKLDENEQPVFKGIL